jgi:DNA-binding IclR family transcriptional regulator
MPQEGAQTVERALAVLESVARAGATGQTVTKLCAETGLQKTTVIRLLTSLRKHGYVTRDATGAYRLGSSALALGAAAGRGLQEVAHPHLETLVRTTGETALLQVLHGDESLCIDKVDSPMPIRVSYEIGRSGPLFAGTSGKVLLAFMPEADREAYLSRARLVRFTATTIVDRRQLRKNLEQIRSQGYVETFGELDEGVCGIGVPVWNGMGKLAAGVALVIPASRWSPEVKRHHLQAVSDAASAISFDLGYRGPGPGGDDRGKP